MRITIEGGTWDNARGYGRFTRELLTAVAGRRHRHELTLVLASDQQAEVPPELQTRRVALSKAPGQAASADGRRSLRDAWTMSRALTAGRPDLVFFPSVYTFVPLTTYGSSMVCIHDVIPERFPQHVFPTRSGRALWWMKTRLAVRQATRIATVSDHARRGIAAHFGVDAEEIRVVPEAASSSFRPDVPVEEGVEVLRASGLAPDARFFLYVGGIAPHKNLVALVQATAAVRSRPGCGDVQLVIAGDFERDVFHSSYQQVRAEALSRLAGACAFTGRISDAAAAALMRLCTALVLPSLDEGFGLPGIEAAACGAPVVATMFSALPEVLGDAAAFFNPRDTPMIADLLYRVLTDDGYRRSLGERAANRASFCTWDAAATRLLAVFDELEADR